MLYHTLKGDPALLAMSQMLMCMCLGFFQLRYSCGLFVSRQSSGGWLSIHRNKLIQRPMLILGSLRFTTLVLGLTSLNYVPVSFAETIKSSGPMFTVVISSIFTGEKTGIYVNLSLIPIMGGLALCSATELSFNMQGRNTEGRRFVANCTVSTYGNRWIVIFQFNQTSQPTFCSMDVHQR